MAIGRGTARGFGECLFGHVFTGFLVLGGVFLCATGAEALYADMGHFGPRPIRLTWYGLVLPTLVLNYAGQTAVLVDGGGAASSNPFFTLCPASLQLPLVAPATLATIIASQAIISGTFSMTRQAIQLGLCPRLHITQTSSQGYGQIYVGFVNCARKTKGLIAAKDFLGLRFEEPRAAVSKGYSRGRLSQVYEFKDAL